MMAMSVAGLVLTVLVVAGAMTLLRGPDTGEQTAAGGETGSAAAPAEVAPRPDCPSTGVGEISLPCLGGGEGGSESGQGVTLVNVWAWWCGPCRDELPYLEEYSRAHPDITVVGVHADANAANGAAFLNDLGIELASYQDDDNTFAGTLGLPGVVPVTALFVDGEMVEFFPRTFESVSEIEQSVDSALADAA